MQKVGLLVQQKRKSEEDSKHFLHWKWLWKSEICIHTLSGLSIDNFGSSDDDINIVKKIMISTRCIVGIWFPEQLVKQILNGL